jgi:anti-sigma B factor antagonist
MAELGWFTPPRPTRSAAERRCFARYPAGPSLRGRLILSNGSILRAERVYTLSPGGVGFTLAHAFPAPTAAVLELENLDRFASVRRFFRTRHVRIDGTDTLIGGAFERELATDEFERLTPTLSPWLELEPAGGVLVGRFARPDLGDDQAVWIVGDQLFGLVEELGHRHFLLNFQLVERLSCAFLSQLIRFRQRVRQVGGRLTLCGLNPLVCQIFEATSLTRVFRIFGTEAEALASFRIAQAFPDGGHGATEAFRPPPMREDGAPADLVVLPG